MMSTPFLLCIVSIGYCCAADSEQSNSSSSAQTPQAIQTTQEYTTLIPLLPHLQHLKTGNDSDAESWPGTPEVGERLKFSVRVHTPNTCEKILKKYEQRINFNKVLDEEGNTLFEQALKNNKLDTAHFIQCNTQWPPDFSHCNQEGTSGFDVVFSLREQTDENVMIAADLIQEALNQVIDSYTKKVVQSISTEALQEFPQIEVRAERHTPREHPPDTSIGNTSIKKYCDITEIAQWHVETEETKSPSSNHHPSLHKSISVRLKKMTEKSRTPDNEKKSTSKNFVTQFIKRSPPDKRNISFDKQKSSRDLGKFFISTKKKKKVLQKAHSQQEGTLICSSPRPIEKSNLRMYASTPDLKQLLSKDSKSSLRDLECTKRDKGKEKEDKGKEKEER